MLPAQQVKTITHISYLSLFWYVSDTLFLIQNGYLSLFTIQLK